MKGLLHEVNVPIYGQRVYVCFCKDTVTDRFGMENWKKSDCDGFSVQVRDIRNDQTAFVMYIGRVGQCISVSVTSHECYHIADLIFEHCGVEYKTGSGNEHMAYLLDWLVKTTFDCLEVEEQFEGAGKNEENK